MNNYKPGKNEKPLYYSTTVENGEIVHHEGDEAYAVYSSQIDEINRRANLWHEWLDNNVPDAYQAFGGVKDDVMAKYGHICRQIMSKAIPHRGNCRY